MTRVVVCCDGTWNVADPDGGSPTNVVKFAMSVAAADEEGQTQRVSYDPGVGTGPRDRLRGGLVGFGLSRNVREAYRFLAETVADGDDIYLVGFSRGAFTVRSVAGLIENCGLLRAEYADRTDEAYRIYRSRRDDERPGGIAAELFRRTYARPVPIRFLGVFDTVGALGIPLSGGRLGKVLNGRWAFHRTGLGASVERAFHALAIDERRTPYRPTLWEQARPEQHVEQVWFRGAHSDVGGGHAEPDLADVTLRWMAGKARWCGLAFDEDALAGACAEPLPDPGGPGGSREERCRASRARGAWIHPDPRGERHHPDRWYRWIPGAITPRELGSAPGEAVASVAREHPDPLPPGFAAVPDDRWVDVSADVPPEEDGTGDPPPAPTRPLPDPEPRVLA